ncbi:hypothetical protein [Chryseobacterium indoltheticum]|uniref:hypothetical protein n=1 Tax=Chryseobacterium indoltheticum TaxID=254 RepID=UPI001914BD0B|nr:hypothetical protein [Chryseobacterium indoltheticum]QQQ29061.1 hypothetical protein JJL46_03355 [Chryseobacterium indoltheticum]
MFKIIDEELKSRTDDFSQDVVMSQIELLLNTAVVIINGSLSLSKQSMTVLLRSLRKF